MNIFNDLPYGRRMVFNLHQFEQLSLTHFGSSPCDRGGLADRP
jgi:hypothetical protein